MNPSRRYKYGVFLHPAIENPQFVAGRFVDQVLASFVDAEDPTLGSVTLKRQFSVVRVDGTTVFSLHHSGDTWGLVSPEESEANRAGVLECLDWWNSETILLAPADKGLVWDNHALPNAWSESWIEGLTVQTITQYPKRLGSRVLGEWSPGLLFFPFEFTYDPPTPEQELAARQAWANKQNLALQTALKSLEFPTDRTWFRAGVLRYRDLIAPDPTRMTHVGTEEEAEAWAEDYRGLCFLVNAATGQSRSRWAER